MESEKAEELAKREKLRQEVEATLPPEPAEGAGDSITKIKFRLPKGDCLERRFTNKSPLKVRSFLFLVSDLLRLHHCCRSS